jgi:chromosomal replication initiation ATPase DnaA
MTTQFAFEFPHRPAFGADDFLIAPSNAAAVAWLDRWPVWPSSATVLHGPPGCGKTHLAHVWQARSDAVLRAAASLAPHDVASLAANAAVVIDDAEGAAERPLLHLANLIAERGGHLLLTAAAPPARWPTALPDLRSRLVAMPEIAMLAPDDALIGALLLKLFADRQLGVGEEVVVFLLHHMERSFAAARRIVAALDRAALVAQRRVTVPLAREVLAAEDAGGPDADGPAAG